MQTSIAQNAASGATDIVLWLFVLAILVIAGGAALFAIRRWILGGKSDSTSPGGLTLHDLRSMLASGTMTQEEFEAAKRQLLVAQGISKGTKHEPTKSKTISSDQPHDKQPHDDP